MCDSIYPFHSRCDHFIKYIAVLSLQITVHVYIYIYMYIWWRVCQKQVSRAGTGNYIPQILWGVITWSCLWYLFLLYNLWVPVCQKQVQRTGTSNYGPQILWNVITCPWPWYLLLAHKSSYYLWCHAVDLRCAWWRHQMESFPRYWPFVRGIHRSPVNSPHKGQWRGALVFSLICTRINGWVNTGEAGDLRRHRALYDVIVLGVDYVYMCACVWVQVFRAWRVDYVYMCACVWVQVFRAMWLHLTLPYRMQLLIHAWLGSLHIAHRSSCV